MSGGDLPRLRRFSLPKKERLRRKRAFEYLFEHGNSVRVGVLTFLYAANIPDDWTDAPVSVAVTAPKRKFKRAVDRNLLKRRMREAYRQHKYILIDKIQRLSKNIVVLIIYRSHKITDYQVIQHNTIKGLETIAQRLNAADEDQNQPNPNA